MNTGATAAAVAYDCFFFFFFLFLFFGCLVETGFIKGRRISRALIGIVNVRHVLHLRSPPNRPLCASIASFQRYGRCVAPDYRRRRQRRRRKSCSRSKIIENRLLDAHCLFEKCVFGSAVAYYVESSSSSVRTFEPDFDHEISGRSEFPSQRENPHRERKNRGFRNRRGFGRLPNDGHRFQPVRPASLGEIPKPSGAPDHVLFDPQIRSIARAGRQGKLPALCGGPSCCLEGPAVDCFCTCGIRQSFKRNAMALGYGFFVLAGSSDGINPESLCVASFSLDRQIGSTRQNRLGLANIRQV